jgi:hypothetical protein
MANSLPPAVETGRLDEAGSRVHRQPATHADIVPDEGMPLEVWGVVTTVIKSLMPR